MTERKTKRPALRRAATLGLAAALVLALGSVAYASDLGGIQRTVQLWLNGEMTDATLTVNEGSYTLRYPDKDGTEREMERRWHRHRRRRHGAGADGGRDS